MKKIITVLLILTTVFVLSACEKTSDIKCGAGTEYSDGQCLAPVVDQELLVCESGYELNAAKDACVVETEELTCDTGYELNESGDACVLETIEPLVCESGYELNEAKDACVEEIIDLEIDPYGLETLANVDFTDSDLSAWVADGNINLSHDVNGYLVANVTAFTGEFYQENISIGNLNTATDHTYTITFTAKTDIENGRDVQFFLEDTDLAYFKYFMETETLTTEFQTFTYTFVAINSNNDTKIGLFLGEMVNASLGSVIIDSIEIVKVVGLLGTNLEDLENSDFSNSDLSNWETEGNVTVTYDVNGYLVADVTGFTGNFWEENLTYGNMITESWVAYTIEIVIKSSVERDVILFAEDTDAGFLKYAEVTETITSEWTTIVLSFTPNSLNNDTKIGLFLGEINGSSLGQIMIDSITITAVPTFN